ncbi:MAG: chromate transporter [Lachnospiraceae bacterium]|nr:chromate transporter [Lachnospiraceae bacterium]
MIFLKLFYEFFKIGLFAVGGGTATIPFLMDLSERVDWFSTQELLDMIAVSQSTPGPIGINMATYVGYTTAGIPGAVLATIALVLPAFLIMLVVARLFMQYKNNRTVEAVFSGIRPAVAGLILYAAWAVVRVTIIIPKGPGIPVDKVGLILCVLIFAAMYLPPLRKLHPVAWIGVGAVLGIVLKL